MLPIKSIIWSISSIQSCLPQKSTDIIKIHSTLCMELDLSSKHLSFISLHSNHYIHDGINLYHLFWLLLPPLLIQLLKRSDVRSGIVQLMHVILRNRFHSRAVNLQCKSRFLFVSHLMLLKIPRNQLSALFCRTSCVSHALFITTKWTSLLWGCHSSINSSNDILDPQLLPTRLFCVHYLPKKFHPW